VRGTHAGLELADLARLLRERSAQRIRKTRLGFAHESVKRKERPGAHPPGSQYRAHAADRGARLLSAQKSGVKATLALRCRARYGRTPSIIAAAGQRPDEIPLKSGKDGSVALREALAGRQLDRDPLTGNGKEDHRWQRYVL
jgi:hypothetical protein